MSDEKLDNLNIYKFIERISTDINLGKYKIFGDSDYSHIDKFVLISVDDPKKNII